MKQHNIKEILESRSIEVSEGSWDKLASRLDAEEEKSKKRKMYPYAAACLAILFGLILFMLTKTETVLTDEVVVESPKEENAIHPEHKNTITTIKKEVPSEIERVAIETKNISKTKNIEKKEQRLETVLSEKAVQEAVVMHKENVEEKRTIPIKEKTMVSAVLADNTIDGQMREDIKASIIALSALEKVTITDEEIEQLLQEGEQSLAHLKINDDIDITKTISADDLLSEVEYELDKSFKQKVFELIKKNVEKTKTVLVDP